nr:MAG TPA: hypothetical protein [Bacteriophage sp.]
MDMIFDMKRISNVNVCAQLKGTKERLNGIEAYRVRVNELEEEISKITSEYIEHVLVYELLYKTI